MVRGIIDGRFGGAGRAAQGSGSAGFQTCCVADFQIGTAWNLPARPASSTPRRCCVSEARKKFSGGEAQQNHRVTPCPSASPRRGGRSLRSQFFRRVRAIHTKASVALSSVRNEDEGRGEEALRDAGPLGISEALLYPPAPAGRGEWSRSTNRSSGDGRRPRWIAEATARPIGARSSLSTGAPRYVSKICVKTEKDLPKHLSFLAVSTS